MGWRETLGMRRRLQDAQRAAGRDTDRDDERDSEPFQHVARGRDTARVVRVARQALTRQHFFKAQTVQELEHQMRIRRRGRRPRYSWFDAASILFAERGFETFRSGRGVAVDEEMLVHAIRAGRVRRRMDEMYPGRFL